jgi:hypothetical protein
MKMKKKICCFNWRKIILTLILIFLIEKKILVFKLKRCNSDYNLVVLTEKKVNSNFNADSLI